MKVVINPETGAKEFTIAGTLKSVSATERTTNTDKKTPYRLATAEVTYPNGTTGTVGALLWGASYDLHTDEFQAGKTVSLRVQLDGEYAGNAIVQLPALNKVDLSMFVGMFDEVANPVAEQHGI